MEGGNYFMTTTIDNRVVGMQFDNQKFESGIKTSINSLDALKKSLNMSGAAKGFDELGRASSRFDLSGMANSISGLSDRFSNLGIVGITTIQNLTNTALNAGKRMVSALTIDPIKTGLNEYETKMGSITTILTNTASKGTTLKDVTDTLDDLNTYADKTIYNFAEMTRNIGTFTAAGVDLETSKVAIKGIANLAAASGSNAQQASTAMYQLSQALASGSVKLMDWNSVVNAGMGGELFKNALQGTAEEMGTDVDGLIKKYGSFRESLTSGWITADVLNTTLKKLTKEGAKEYGEAMLASGKYTQQQVDELMKTAEMAENAATEVKTMTQMFDTMKESVQSGWAQSWESIIGDKDQATKTLTAINNAFGALIGPSADARNEMLAFWNENGGREAMLEGLSNVFKTLGDVLKPIGEAFKEVFPPLTGKRLVEMSKNFRDLTKQFKIGEGTINSIKSAFKGVFSIFNIVFQVAKMLATGIIMLFTAFTPLVGIIIQISGALGKVSTSFSEAIKSTDVFSKAVEKLDEVIKPLNVSFNWVDTLKNGFGEVSKVFYKISESAEKAFSKIREFVSTIDFGKGMDLVNGGIFAVILLGVKKVIDSFDSLLGSGGSILETINTSFGGFSGILDEVRGSLTAYQNQLKAGTLLKIASAVGILAASLFVLSTIDPEKMGNAITAITVLFGELMISMGIFSKMSVGIGLKSMVTLTTMLMALSTALLLLSVALRNIAELEWDEMARGLTGLAGMMTMLIITSKALSSGVVMKGATQFIVLAGALLLMAVALEKISKLKVKEIGKGLMGIALILTTVLLYMKASRMDSMGLQMGASILLLATSLILLATAVKAFGKMNIKELAKGLGAVALTLLTLGMFVSVAGGGTNIIRTAITLNIIAGALLLLAAAIGIMGSMPVSVLAKGLGALAGALTIMAVAMKFMSGSLKGSAALLVMAAALAVLTPSLVILGAMPLKNIGKALLMLAGVFLVLGVAAVVLGPLVPIILGLAGAIALLGVAVLAIGAGILAFSAGMTALAISGAAGGAVLIGIISGVIGLIPYTLQKLGEGILAFAMVIKNGAPVLLDAALTLIRTFLEGILGEIPNIVQKGIEMVLALISGIISMLPTLIQAGFDLVISFINGLAEALRGNTQPLLDAFGNLITALIEFGKSALTMSIPSFAQVGKDIINGLISGIKEMIPDVGAWASKVATGALDAAKKALGVNSPSKEFEKIGQFADQGLINGLKNFAGKVSSSADGVGRDAISALSGAIGNVSDLVSGDMELNPTIRPVLDMAGINGSLNSAFGQQRSLNLAEIRAKASMTSTSNLGKSADVISSGNTKNEFIFNITGNQIANDYDVARIGDQLSAQIMRELRRNQ